MHNKPLYIFDLDGTLALIEHRRKYLDEKEDPHRWDKFFSNIHLDLPNKAVVHVLDCLLNVGNDIWIFSARSDIVKEETIKWLVDNTLLSAEDLHDTLMMRPHSNSDPDVTFKAQLYDRMLDEDKKRLVAIFDDRDRVVEFWRSKGVTCFQVAKGNF